jgi:hypothetical protein
MALKKRELAHGECEEVPERKLLCKRWGTVWLLPRQCDASRCLLSAGPRTVEQTSKWITGGMATHTVHIYS